jgi:glucose/arabinose dehydrogenase
MLSRPLRLARVAALLVLAGAAPALAQGQVKSVPAATGLSDPIFVTAPNGDPRLFVVERSGRIRIVENGVTREPPFLDIRSRVGGTGEGGLLGLAFPADYASSGLFTVYYTNAAVDSVVARYSVTADPDLADPDSEEVLLFIDQPDGVNYTNHKGGTVHYGPDGFLWFATGDGGAANDPTENAQDPQSLLGKMLRIDVGPTFAPGSIPVAGQVYRIPADNPFVGSAPRDEIWALGLRNPFRWSFDRATGDLWIGDVGQSALEEVDFEAAADSGGRNYGWDVMEGGDCNGDDPASAPPCNDPSLTLPVHQYGHGASDCSIIGGNVWRSDSSALRGLYFFGDFCTGRVWTFSPSTLRLVERSAQLGSAARVPYALVSFGEDGLGRVHMVHRTSGTVYRLAAVTQPSQGCGGGPELALLLPVLAALRRARSRRTLAA